MSASASMGSPSAVPVPWASTVSTPRRGPAGCAGQRLADDALLRGPVRRREPVAGAVLVDRRSAHRLPSPGWPLRRASDSRSSSTMTDAFAPARAVGGGGERLAPAVRRQAALPGESGEHLGGGHHRDPTGKSKRAFALPQCLRRQVHGDERRRARRFHRDGRALQPEGVGDAARQQAWGVARVPLRLPAPEGRPRRRRRWWPYRRRPPWGSPSARGDRFRHARTLPMRFRATAAVAGWWPAPRAG
jgi:hypothetical protein